MRIFLVGALAFTAIAVVRAEAAPAPTVKPALESPQAILAKAYNGTTQSVPDLVQPFEPGVYFGRSVHLIDDFDIELPSFEIPEPKLVPRPTAPETPASKAILFS